MEGHVEGEAEGEAMAVRAAAAEGVAAAAPITIGETVRMGLIAMLIAPEYVEQRERWLVREGLHVRCEQSGLKSDLSLGQGLKSGREGPGGAKICGAPASGRR